MIHVTAMDTCQWVPSQTGAAAVLESAADKLLNVDAQTGDSTTSSKHAYYGVEDNYSWSSDSSSSPEYSDEEEDVDVDEDGAECHRRRQLRNLVIEVPGVLLHYLPSPTVIPEKLLARALRTRAWFDHETGAASADATARALPQGELFAGFPDPERAVRDGLMRRPVAPPPPALLQALDLLRARPGVRVLCASNVSRDEHRRLRALAPALYARFGGDDGGVFTSWELGVRKPAAPFLRRVVAAAGVEPAETLLVDCVLETAVAARALGMAAIVVAPEDSPAVLARAIVAHFDDWRRPRRRRWPPAPRSCAPTGWRRRSRPTARWCRTCSPGSRPPR